MYARCEELLIGDVIVNHNVPSFAQDVSVHRRAKIYLLHFLVSVRAVTNECQHKVKLNKSNELQKVLHKVHLLDKKTPQIVYERRIY